MREFKILVVDNDKETLHSIEMGLMLDGFFTETSCDPLEALEILKVKRFDLLILDYSMPSMNGDVFVQKVREFNSDLHIILLTGLGEDAIPAKETIKRLDIQGYCKKGDNDLQSLNLDVILAYKIAMQRRRIVDYKEKLQSMVEFIPRLFNSSRTELMLAEMVRKVANLFGVSDVFLLMNNIGKDCGDNTDMGKSLYSGVGKYDFPKNDFLNNLGMEFISQIGVVSDTKQLTKTKSGLLLPLYNNQFPNIGILYVEMKSYEDYREFFGILSHQLAAILGNYYLYQMSVMDGLTKVYNRLYIENFLIRNEFEHGKNSNICVAIIDIDDFKKVNDKYGHPNGDVILKEVAGIIKNTVRKSDIVARYGGEEFAVVFTSATLQESLIASEKIRKNIASNKFKIKHEGNEVTLGVSVSIGVASYLDFDSYAGLVEAADKALYEAKGAGKDRVCSRNFKDRS